jgi:hypothetical protein
MAKFLVLYHGNGTPDPAQMAQAKAAFGKWLGEVGSAVTDPGAPTRMVGQVPSSSHEKPADVGGYSVIEAASAADAMKLLQSHPFVSRGGTLQVNELVAV